jgi:signal transduction histidine kinase
VKPWTDAVLENPVPTAALGAAMVLISAGCGMALRRVTRHTRSLHHLVLAITLSSLVIGAVASLVLARLMVLEGDETQMALVVLAVTAVLATLLAIVAAGPLARDTKRIESTLRDIEAGDRAVRTEVERSDELGHVARALDALVARLDDLERERATFDEERRLMLTSIGHDLRTPLSALRAAVESLADGVAPDPQRYLRSMSADVEALGSLIDDLFLLSSLEAGRYELARTPVDLAEIADEAVEALAPTAAARSINLRLRTDGAVLAHCNAAAIGRVIRNLIDNAVRHAPHGSTVEVEVSNQGRPRVRVVDEGPGFDPEFAAHAFERFSRADASRTRATGGAGLGLAIARGIVEAHDGRIWIDGNAERGGSVSFDVPRGNTVEQTTSAPF